MRGPRQASGAVTAGPYADIADATLLPRIVPLGPGLFGAVFTLMKLVPARAILRKAVARGELGPDTVVVETTSGNFGLALAMEAALLRRRFVLVSDPVIDPHLRRRLEDLGTRVEICDRPAPVGGWQEARLRRVEEIRAELDETFWPDQYANPDNPGAYDVVAEHLDRVLGPVDCVVGPVGSGGSMCGTVRALRRLGPDVRAIAVDTHRSVLFGEPDGPRTLRGLGMSVMPPNLDHRLFDEVHWCTAAEAFASTRQLHRAHALFQGPTSGAAYRVARWWSARHRGARCVVLLPDDGYRYQSTVYDDRWLRAEGFDLAGAAREPVDVVRAGAQEGRGCRMRWGRRSYREAVGGEPPGRPAPAAEALA